MYISNEPSAQTEKSSKKERNTEGTRKIVFYHSYPKYHWYLPLVQCILLWNLIASHHIIILKKKSFSVDILVYRTIEKYWCFSYTSPFSLRMLARFVVEAIQCELWMSKYMLYRCFSVRVTIQRFLFKVQTFYFTFNLPGERYHAHGTHIDKRSFWIFTFESHTQSNISYYHTNWIP